VFGAVELLGNEPSIPAQDRVGFRDAGDLPKRLLPEPFSDLGESGALRIPRRNRVGNLALKIRFSAARYSFRNRSSWFTEPLT